MGGHGRGSQLSTGERLCRTSASDFNGFAYVLEGEIVSQVGDGPETTYSAGQMFMETPNQLHGVSRNASSTKPAKLLALLLAEKGKQLTTPA